MSGMNLKNYERKVQSFAGKVADLIAEMETGKIPPYHLTSKAKALESAALELEKFKLSKDKVEYTDFDLEDFKKLDIPRHKHLCNASVLRFWKKKFNITTDTELLQFWRENGGGKDEGGKN